MDHEDTRDVVQIPYDASILERMQKGLDWQRLTPKQQIAKQNYLRDIERWEAAIGICDVNVGGDTVGDSVSEEEMTILESLKSEHPMTVTQESLAGMTRLSDRTVRKCVKRLREEAGLTNRPRGPKKGEALTAKGLALLSER